MEDFGAFVFFGFGCFGADLDCGGVGCDGDGGGGDVCVMCGGASGCE